tara:strand:- start:936 stop:1769 length:834 start_codon:yes stop_codon:yes gene_type:complete
MLGLGNSITGGAALEEAPFTPASIDNLTLWLAVNTNITADQDDGGALSPEHTSNGGDMVNSDRVNFWGGSGGTSINAVQTLGNRKPRWDTTTGNLGSVRSGNSNKFMDLSDNITFDANTDFTVVIRFKPDDASDTTALMGISGSEFIRKQGDDTIRVKVDDPASTSTNNDIVFGTSMQDDEIITLILVRSDGATGNINAFLRSNVSGYFDGTATGVAAGNTLQENQEIIVSNIMAQGDSDNEFDGNFYDVIIYNGTAVTPTQREQLFDYIEGQSHPQ